MITKILNDEDMSSLIYRLYTKNNSDKNFLNWFSHTEYLYNLYPDDLGQFIDGVNLWLTEHLILSVLVSSFKGDIRKLRSIEWTVQVLYDD